MHALLACLPACLPDAEAPKGLGGAKLPSKKEPKAAGAASPGGSKLAAAAAAGGSTPAAAAKPAKDAVPMVRVEARSLEVGGMRASWKSSSCCSSNSRGCSAAISYRNMPGRLP
jgi:hypothetical protein